MRLRLNLFHFNVRRFRILINIWCPLSPCTWFLTLRHPKYLHISNPRVSINSLDSFLFTPRAVGSRAATCLTLDTLFWQQLLDAEWMGVKGGITPLCLSNTRNTEVPDRLLRRYRCRHRQQTGATLVAASLSLSSHTLHKPQEPRGRLILIVCQSVNVRNMDWTLQSSVSSRCHGWWEGGLH